MLTKRRNLFCWVAASGIALMAFFGCSSSKDGGEYSGLNRPVPNPYLSSSLYGITHFDSSQSDSTPYGPPHGVFQVDPSIQPISYGGPVNIMTLASTNPDYMWAVGTDRVAYVFQNSGQWRPVAELQAPAFLSPDLNPVPAETHRSFAEIDPAGMTAAQMNELLTLNYGRNYRFRILNGAYSVVDRDDILYVNFGNGIYALGLVNHAAPSEGIAILRKIDDVRVLQSDPPPSTIIFGLALTYDGRLIVTFNNGLAVIGRDLNLASSVFYPFDSDEINTNSIAVDDQNGIYVATDKLMRKLVWTGTTLSDLESDGAWSSAYDAPADALPPVIKFGLGTGSTPTLMGFGSDPDKLVVITDGAKRMKLVAFWRDGIPARFIQKPGTASRRIAGQIQATCGFTEPPDWIQSEQSVVVYGYGALVVNNIPAGIESTDLVGANKLLAVSLMGPAYDTSFGVERFEWDLSRDEWFSVWARPDISSTSMVPIHSRSENMAIVSGYTDANGWEVNGLDWDTGATVHQTLLGRQNFGNGAYAILEYLENGDLLFNSITGPFRVHYGD